MKLKPFLVGLVVAGLGTSVAFAAPPAGKGKPEGTGPGCKPKVTVVLKGTLAATPGPAGTSLSVNVTKTNKFGQAYLAAAQPVTVAVDAKTKYRKQGKKTIGDLLTGDRVLVQARACKLDLAGTTLPVLTATRVVAQAAKTTTTTTTTTSSESTES